MKTFKTGPIYWLAIGTLITLTLNFKGYTQNRESVAYIASIELIDRTNVVKGLLYQVQDSAVILFLGKDTKSASANSALYKTVPAEQIYRIKLRPRGKVSRSAKKGAIYGALGGLALGGLEAAAYEADPWLEADTGELLLAGAISGAMTGAIYGAIIGSIKTKIPIDGNQQRFFYQTDFLRGHAYHLGVELQTQSQK